MFARNQSTGSFQFMSDTVQTIDLYEFQYADDDTKISSELSLETFHLSRTYM